MFDWLPKKVEEVIPDALRPAFEKKFLDQLKRDARDAQIAIQRQIPAEIEQVQAQINELIPKETAANSQLAEAEQALVKAQADVTAARVARDLIHWQLFEMRGNIERLKARQAAHGSVVLTEFYSEMLKEWEKLRNSGSHEMRESKPHFITGKTTKTFWTNRPAVERAVTYVRAAMAEAEEMKSQPLHDDEIKARLDALRKGIPDHRELVEIETISAVFIENEKPRYGEPDPPRYF